MCAVLSCKKKYAVFGVNKKKSCWQVSMTFSESFFYSNVGKLTYLWIIILGTSNIHQVNKNGNLCFINTLNIIGLPIKFQVIKLQYKLYT